MAPRLRPRPAAAAGQLRARKANPDLVALLETEIMRRVSSGLVVDLTQEIGPQTLLWPGSRPFEARVVGEVATDGHFERDLVMPEHIGTHLDAPSHFATDGASVAEIPPERLVVEAVVIDVREEAIENPDYVLELTAVEAFEADHGPVEPGSAVLMLTGWDDRRTDRASYFGGMTAHAHHFPGFGPDAANLLIDRGAVGLGTETASIDAGSSTEFPVHGLTLAAGLWHLEGLINVSRLPPRGAQLFVGVLPIESGSGGPARVLAVLPEANGGSSG